jgi:hypothetical protein
VKFWQKQFYKLAEDYYQKTGIRLESVQFNPNFVWSWDGNEEDICGQIQLLGRKKTVINGTIQTENYTDNVKTQVNFQQI